MSERLIVLVADTHDPKHGEIAVLEDLDEAWRLIETVLEAGFEEDRIRVFKGSGLAMRVDHQPVVSLVDGEPGGAADLDSIDV
jgi:hypothetical protein